MTFFFLPKGRDLEDEVRKFLSVRVIREVCMDGEGLRHRSKLRGDSGIPDLLTE